MNKETPALRTKRLQLRALRHTDAHDLFSVFSDEQVCKWWTGPAHRQLCETTAYVDRSVKDPGAQTWVITMDNDRALGWVYLGDRKSGIAELGFILGRDHWGKGLISEAANAVITYAFTIRKLRRIYADADPDNAGSRRVIEKLGFSFEGIARANWETHIGVRDSLIYGLVATDPRPSA